MHPSLAPHDRRRLLSLTNSQTKLVASIRTVDGHDRGNATPHRTQAQTHETRDDLVLEAQGEQLEQARAALDVVGRLTIEREAEVDDRDVDGLSVTK